MKYVNTIGLDLANTFFRFTAPIWQAHPCSIRNCVAAKCCGFFKNCLHVWLDGGMRWRSLLGARDREPRHEWRLIPPAYVKPFVKRGKTDAADAKPSARR